MMLCLASDGRWDTVLVRCAAHQLSPTDAAEIHTFTVRQLRPPAR
jgi:hypothetical protein